MKRALIVLVAGGAFVLVFGVLLVAAAWSEIMPPEIPRATFPLFVLVQLGMPALVAWFIWNRLSKRWVPSSGVTRSSWRSKVRGIVVLAYAATVVFGLPAVQSDQTAWAISEYKQAREHGPARVFEAHPYIRTFAAIPVAPAVVVTYHEYQLSGLYGLGGFEIYLWYAVGTKSLGCLPLWLS